MDFGAALMGLFIGFVIKVFVMVLAGVLMVRLYRISLKATTTEKMWLIIPDDQRHRFLMLTCGLILFFISELTCGIEVYILTRSSPIISSLHSITSAFAMAFTAVGMFQLFDWKYFHLVERNAPCIATKSCGICTKRALGYCQYRSTLLTTATLVFFMAVPIFFASTTKLYANPKPYVLPFQSWNIWYDNTVIPWLNRTFSNVVTDGTAFYLPEAMLIIEFRILPIVGMLLSALSIFVVLAKKEDLGITLLLMALGILGYSYFEAVIYALTHDVIFGSLMHETGEFIFLVMAADILLKMFPKKTSIHE